MNSMQSAAKQLSSAGRYGDTMLAHINPRESELLQALGGSGTINPETGLPEYFSLKKIGKKLKKGVKKVGNLASKAAPLASFIPGVGPIAAAGLGAGGALVGGKSLKTALKRGVAGGLGGLAIGQMGGAGALGKLGGMFGGASGGSPFAAIGDYLGGSGLSGASGIGGSLFGGGGSSSGFDLGSILGGGSGSGGFDLNGIGGSLFGGGSSSGDSNPFSAISSFLGGGSGGSSSGGSPWGALGSAALGGLAGGLGGGGKGATGTTSSLQDWQKPYVQQAMAGAQQQYQNGMTPPPMSGASSGAISNLAGGAAGFGGIRDQFNTLGKQQFGINDYGLQGAANKLAGTQAATAGNAYDGGYLRAANGAAGLKASVGQEGQYISDTLGGKYLDPSSNPYLQGTYDKAARSVISNNDSLFASGGRFNSGAGQRALATGLGDMATDLYGQNYQMERGRMGEAAQMAAAQSGRQDNMTQFGVGQQLNALGNYGQRQDAANQFSAGQANNWNQYTSGQQLNAMQNLGQRSDAMTQFGANNALQANQGALSAQSGMQSANRDALGAGQYQDAFNYQNWQAPWQNINNYLGAVGGNYGSAYTQKTPQNTASNILGGITGGLGIYGQLFGNG